MTPADQETRAVDYLADVPAAISGQGGHKATMWAARCMCWGFDLGPDRGFDILWDHYNPRCVPEWSESELRRKCREAMNPNGFKHPRGWLLEAERERPAPRTSTSAVPPPGPPAVRLDPSELAGPRPTDAPAPDQIRPDGWQDWAATEGVGQGGGPLAVAKGSPQLLSPGVRCGVTIRNFVEIGTGNGGLMRMGIPPQQITRELLAVTGGWPKASAGKLFVPGPDQTPVWLEDATKLFAWLATVVGAGDGLVEWGRKEGHITKPEYYAHLITAVEQFDDVQTFPHFPPRAGTCYLHPPLPAGGAGAFDELLSMFTPDQEEDRFLLRAFFLTLVWGGKPGGRPVFVFESSNRDGKPGQGSGKSTVVQKAGELFGGYLSIDLATDDGKDLMPRLLSAQGRRARLVVFDNLKGTRISSSLIESNVTASVLSGRQLYAGEGARPNILSWAITANQASFSKDLTRRSYTLRVRPPVYSPEWEERISRFIQDNRWQIIADMIAELSSGPIELLADGEWDRWAAWEQGVLCRVCDPVQVKAAVRERREDLDDDDVTASIVREAIAKFIRSWATGKDPEKCRLKMPAEAVAQAVKDVSPHGKNIVSTCRWLASINVPGIQRKKSGSSRYWLWEGSGGATEEDWHTVATLWGDINGRPRSGDTCREGTD